MIDEQFRDGWLIHEEGRGWMKPPHRPFTSNPALAERHTRETAYCIVHLTNLRHERPVMTMIHESLLGLPRRQPADLREALIALRLDNDEASDEHRDGFQLCRVMVLELLDLLEATGRAQGGAA